MENYLKAIKTLNQNLKIEDLKVLTILRKNIFNIK